ncbi:phosphoadenylyl-sulfate reductase [Roseixanthobacter glucoisosaccharinicivorans]|uniref:phosphoadenylyl-sulfate reductase n=1 Tax=Roseixanthobacter glucoisosaccharinicivorans TaxID=3119923 RepID=UPI0037297B44
MSNPSPLLEPETVLARRAAELNARLEDADPRAIIAAAQEDFSGRVASVSSFGAESVVLLHMVAQVDRAMPVLFLDTGHLFPETLAYRDQLIDRLGLTQVLTSHPDEAERTVRDGDNDLWASDTDACCALRKVEPLARALSPFDAWLNGRKRYQAVTRLRIPVVEADGRHIKFNPLAAFGPGEIASWIQIHGLPEHPLKTFGFASVGCMPCTSRVAPGEDSRAGRWRGAAKTECGIHLRRAG